MHANLLKKTRAPKVTIRNQSMIANEVFADIAENEDHEETMGTNLNELFEENENCEVRVIDEEEYENVEVLDELIEKHESDDVVETNEYIFEQAPVLVVPAKSREKKREDDEAYEPNYYYQNKMQINEQPNGRRVLPTRNRLPPVRYGDVETNFKL